jgi:transposase
MISAELRAKIRRLFFAEHWTVGTIAQQLGVHHKTVRAAIECDRFAPYARPVRASALDRYKKLIEQILEDYPRLRATRIHRMLVERGYSGSVVQVRRYVRTVRPAVRREAFLRLETLSGEQGQVDWGHFGRINVGRARRALSCFVMVLAHSRAIYARFALDQSLESFVRGHVAAFEAFGGVPRELLYDNLKSVVVERNGDLIRFHPTLLELAGHYHFAPKPCAPYRANEKGKVERAIQYLRRSFFDAHHFGSVAELNIEVASWVEHVANQRPWPGRGDPATVHEVFEQERPHLLPLPEHRFEHDLVKTVRSGKTPYVRFDLNDYSISPDRVRKPLTLIASEHRVRITDGVELVADHARSYDRDCVIEAKAHIEALRDRKRHARDLRGRDRLTDACPAARSFLQALLDRDVPIRPQTAHLNRLLDRYGSEALADAIQVAIERGAIAASSVDQILDQRTRARGAPPPLQTVLPNDRRVRDLRVKNHDLEPYDALASQEDPDDTP